MKDKAQLHKLEHRIFSAVLENESLGPFVPYLRQLILGHPVIVDGLRIEKVLDVEYYPKTNVILILGSDNIGATFVGTEPINFG